MHNKLISRLKKVRKTGDNSWVACCPAHEDKSPSLAIKDNDGIILLKCFAGCGAHEIVSAVGLQVRDLYRNNNYQYHNRPQKNTFPAHIALECVQQASLVVLIQANRLAKGEGIDYEALINAITTIQNAYER